MRRLLLAVAGVALPIAAMAQSSPSLTFLQVPSASQWNSYFSGKVDTSNGSASGLTLTGGNLSAASVTSGGVTQTLSTWVGAALGNASGSLVTTLGLNGSQTQTLATWTSYLAGVNNPNPVVIDGPLSGAGVSSLLATYALLLSPSLTTPTIAGATLSGTIAGSPSFSGTPNFAGSLGAGSNAAANTLININGAASGERGIALNTANSARWRIMSTGANSGNNAGDSLFIQNFSDTGSQIGNIFTINRSSGALSLRPVTGPTSLTTSSFQNTSYTSVNGATGNEFGFTLNNIYMTGFGEKNAVQVGATNVGYNTGATGTGSITGTVLTVATVGSGVFAQGMWLNGSGIIAGTTINGPQISGTVGGAGTYPVNNSQSVSTESIATSNIPTAWATATPYSTGQEVTVGFYLLRVTSAGTSGVTTPTCTTAGTTCSDGAVAWISDGTLGGEGYQQNGLFVGANLSANMGGTSSGAIGVNFGFNPNCTLTATFAVSNVCEELDVALSQPALDRIGSQILAGASGTHQGSRDDIGWRIGNTASTAPFQTLMAWGTRTTGTTIDPNGYGLRVWSQGWNIAPFAPAFMAGSGGLDLEEFNPNGSGYFGGGFILRGPGSQILGSGDIQSNYALIHKTTTGGSLDVSQNRVTGVSISSGGSGWASAGWLADCADGTIVKIQTVSGGAVTAVVSTPFYGAFSSSTTSTTTCTSEQEVGLTDSTGNLLPPSTITVNETWALANSGAPILTLGGTAAVQFGAAEWTANGSVGTTVTSLGPTGSHTTIQEWLTVTDSAGTVRYIPAY